MEKKLYEAVVTTTAGRNGHARSSDGLLDLDVRLPKDLGGPGAATNPEQLFAAGWAACFGSSFLHVASLRKLTVSSIAVTARVSLLVNDGAYGLAAQLTIAAEGIAQEAGNTLLEEAKKVCAYSNATRGNVPVEYVLNITQ